MSDPFGTYLADHLAGSAHAVELVKHLRDEYRDDELGRFATGLLQDIEADQAVLQEVAFRAGSGPSELKDIAGWLGERISRIKLSHRGKDSLGTFEALEHLALGIQGKLALWRVLAAIASSDARLKSIDFDKLAGRAIEQHARVEERRMDIGRRIFLRHEEAAGA